MDWLQPPTCKNHPTSQDSRRCPKCQLPFCFSSFKPPHPAPLLLSRSKPPPNVAMGSTSAYRAATRFFCLGGCLAWNSANRSFRFKLGLIQPPWRVFLLKKTKQFWSPKWFPHHQIRIVCFFSWIFPTNKEHIHHVVWESVFGAWRGFGSSWQEILTKMGPLPKLMS